MTDAVIVSTARTGLAKSWRGAFNMTHGATLGGHVVKHAIERARLDQLSQRLALLLFLAVLVDMRLCSMVGMLAGMHRMCAG